LNGVLVCGTPYLGLEWENGLADGIAFDLWNERFAV
jgi:hypothetical protein